MLADRRAELEQLVDRELVGAVAQPAARRAGKPDRRQLAAVRPARDRRGGDAEHGRDLSRREKRVVHAAASSSP
jgi:hypothetical protein